ncbi:MAG: hypothetical protein ABI227_06465 [Rhodanobacter sp.]
MKTEKTPAEQLLLAEEQIDWALSHPDMSSWLKNALSMARGRNPIDVLNDLELLQTLLQARSRALIDQTLAI